MSSREKKDQLVSFAPHIEERPPLADWDTREERNRQMLSHALNLCDTILFCGAGCSRALDYPDWKELAGDAIEIGLHIVSAHDKIDSKSKREYASRLNLLRERISQNPLPSDLTYALGACEKICSALSRAEEFRDSLAGRFNRSASENPHNPYKALVKLPVHRFVTSNYDCELENALVNDDERGVRKEDYIYDAKGFGKKSFTQLPKYDDQLAIFSIAYAGYDPMVFHCHGWCHEPESMVLTEDDYQRWYFRDQAIGGGRYRQTIDLTFDSNPILFVGFSLSDDDLLVPLRFLSAVERRGKESRPLFALLEKFDTNTEERFDQLFDRYGINVISYPAASSEEARAEAFCKEINDIRTRCRDHRKEWLTKPSLGGVTAGDDSKCIIHLRPKESSQLSGDKHRKDPLFSDLREKHLVWFVGPSGTGMSWESFRLLDYCCKHNDDFKFEGFFLWSFRYCNDALSGIERAVSLMGMVPGRPETLLTDLAGGLQQKRYFIVLDGVERLLRQDQKTGDVEATTSSSRKFFSSLLEQPLKSLLVLTSRFFLSEFKPFVEHVYGCSYQNICRLLEHVVQSQSDRERFAQSFDSWFRGHWYGAILATQWLTEKRSFDEIEYQMSEADPAFRVSKMISISLKALRESSKGREAYDALERLAVPIEPVNTSVAETMCRNTPGCGSAFGDINALLRNKKLLFEVTDHAGITRFLVHPTVREYIFHHLHRSSNVELPSLELSGFTSGAQAVYPGNRGERGPTTVINLLRGLMTDNAGKDTEHCRTAFSVIRSRMSAMAISRWAGYDEYLKLLTPIINRARELTPHPERWSFARDVPDARTGASGVLHKDEVAWLYNEAGLAYYGAGYMLDAIAVWEQSYEINRRLDGNDDGHYVFQSLCNLGAAYIHFGHLGRAELYLNRALAMGLKLEEPDHVERIKGYLALLSHLRGNLADANYSYETVANNLGELRNMRAQSIVLRHHADLLLRQKSTRKEAWVAIQTSKALAEANYYDDLVAYARLSYGHLRRVEEKFGEAIREYRIALEMARTMGIRRLEAEAQSELARVHLALGDGQVARRCAMKALQIANECVLGLRQTHCLVILGKATMRAGERDLGIYYLRHAKRLADRQEYRLRASEAEAALYEMGEPVEGSNFEAASAS